MVKSAWRVLKHALKEADKDSVPRLGAALAFYTLFSLAPALVMVILIVGTVVDQETARQAVVEYTERVVGPTGVETVTSVMENASLSFPSGPQIVVSAVVFFLAITTAFNALLGTLNYIWHVPSGSRSIVWRFLRRRLVSFALVLGVGLLALFGLLLSTTLSSMRAYYPELLASVPLTRVLNLVVWTGLLTVMIGAIYRVVPDTELSWRDVLTGAILTAVLLSVGIVLIGEYIGRAGAGSAFGAASSLVLLLFWVYYSSQIFLLGAEVTKSYSLHRAGALGS